MKNHLNNRLFALLLVPFIFVGCNNNQPQQTGTASQEPSVPSLGILMPTPEILAALGPENNIPIQRLLPNPLFVVAGKPKQFLASPVSAGGEEIVRGIIAQSLQLYYIDPNDIELFIQSSGFPAFVPVTMQDPMNPGAPPQQSLHPIARRSTMITFDEPVPPSILLARILGVDTIDSITLGLFQRTEGTTEYYDLTPPDIPVPMRLALGFINEKTIVFAEGTDEDIKAIFSDTIPNSAVLERLKHTPMDTSELTMVMSLEGLPVSPEAWERLIEQFGQAGHIPPNFVALINQHLRALTFSLNVSAATGQPIISIYVEGRDEKGAETIAAAIQGTIISAQTTIATMSEAAKGTLPIPADFALSLLGAMSVQSEGTRVYAVLNNFDSFIPTIAGWLSSTQTAMQLEQLQLTRFEKLRTLVQLCAAYYTVNGKLPSDIVDAEGKPLLSWRVPLLTIMGEEERALYNKFKLDEPWDSEFNKELLNLKPIIYHPLTQDVTPPMTVFRFFNSAGTPFANPQLKIEDLESPQSTLMFVMVLPKHAVEWTKPVSLEFDINTLADIVGDSLLGVTFSGQICMIPILPNTDPNYERWKQEIEILIRGSLPPQPQEHQSQEPEFPQPEAGFTTDALDINDSTEG